jgi:hypothetical protein
MRVVGKRKERDISYHASGELLREGALFNTEILKLQSTFCFPRGIFRYRTHEEADNHMNECVTASMVAIRKIRHG